MSTLGEKNFNLHGVTKLHTLVLNQAYQGINNYKHLGRMAVVFLNTMLYILTLVYSVLPVVHIYHLYYRYHNILMSHADTFGQDCFYVLAAVSIKLNLIL